MKPKTKRVLWIAPLAILGMAVFVTVGGLIVRLFWNSLLPPLFGWHAITFWQALGLLVLCRILFGGEAEVRRREYFEGADPGITLPA